MKTVFENEFIKVSQTGRGHDVSAIIKNKTDKDIIMSIDEEEAEENAVLNPIEIPANGCIELIPWEYEGNTQLALSESFYEIKFKS